MEAIKNNKDENSTIGIITQIMKKLAGLDWQIRGSKKSGQQVWRHINKVIQYENTDLKVLKRLIDLYDNIKYKIN